MSVHVHRYTPTDPRLGRHIEHDSRSLDFLHPELDEATLKPVDWTRRIPILDQGQLGSCTGNALTGVLGTDSAGRTATISVNVKRDSHKVFTAGSHVLDETFATAAYELNTRLDSIPGQFPPNDTGSSSLGAGKTGVALGLFSGYTHAVSNLALKSALQKGAVLIGIPWLESMFTPDSGGNVPVDRRSGLAGGHELAVSAWDGARYRIDNSWGVSWGLAGSAWIAETSMAWLLQQGGDVLVPTWAQAAA